MAISNVSPEPEQADRRTALRFPVEQEIRYRVFNGKTFEVGAGKSINMSANGVLFTTERALSRGEQIELAMNWPAQIDNSCPMNLAITGRVVRSDGRCTAIAIEHYELRTQDSQGGGYFL